MPDNARVLPVCPLVPWLRGIQLTRGFITVVDLRDLKKVAKHRWCASDDGTGRIYAKVKTSKKFLALHRFLMKPRKGKEVDHIDGNTLNNTRRNLRVCTKSQNLQNQKLGARNTSGFKGVDIWNGKYRATIGTKGKKYFLGLYTDPHEAHEAYLEAALRLFGEYANDGEGNMQAKIVNTSSIKEDAQRYVEGQRNEVALLLLRLSQAQARGDEKQTVQLANEILKATAEYERIKRLLSSFDTKED